MMVAISSVTDGRLVLPGPTVIVVFGVAVPVLSAVFAVAGVILGRILAPPPIASTSIGRQSALALALIGLALGIVISSGQMPLVALAWGIGLGFSGLTIAQSLGNEAAKAVARISEASISLIAARLGSAAPPQKTDEEGTTP